MSNNNGAGGAGGGGLINKSYASGITSGMKIIQSSEQDCYSESREYRLLASLLKRLEQDDESGRELLVHAILQDEELHKWWSVYKDRQDKLEQHRQENIRIEKLKSEAMSKLTSDEIAALGLSPNSNWGALDKLEYVFKNSIARK